MTFTLYSYIVFVTKSKTIYNRAMTVKEAIIRALEDIGRPAYYLEVHDKIIEKSYYEFGGATPTDTVGAILGDFIRNSDSRVKRVKDNRGKYHYYLSKDELKIDFDDEFSEPVSNKRLKTYNERSLHKLLSSYLKSKKTYSKTIFHEQSKSSIDDNQTWTHPDMIGVEFLSLKTSTSNNLLKSVNPIDAFKISSYELKREVNSDSELKKFYFQAVSNSSWANYGYLVAFEFSDRLYEEMRRLSQAFGIGIIQLAPNPYESEVLFPATYRNLDFSTIDKLCAMNEDFNSFIEHIEKLISASERYYSGTESEFGEFCDLFFEEDSEIEEYCRAHNIPFNNQEA